MYTDQRLEKNLPKKVSISDDLIIGNTYTIEAQNYGTEFVDNTHGGGGKAEKPVKMELIDLYPNFARFKRKAGYTESFSYWDLGRRLLHG